MAADRRLTYWMAPALGCLIVQRTAEFRNPSGGEYTCNNKLTLTRLELGEPQSNYFEIPAGYAEVRPSEAARRLREAKGIRQASRADEEALRRLDAIYEKYKAPSP